MKAINVQTHRPSSSRRFIHDPAQRGQCILVFFVVFTPSPSSHHGSVWVLPVISLLLGLDLHCFAVAGLPIPNHMMGGEVSWDPKRRRSWASSYSILSDPAQLTLLKKTTKISTSTADSPLTSNAASNLPLCPLMTDPILAKRLC
jgi:hypothetical protein